MNLIQKAFEIAVSAHRNQIDKSGQPYILHLTRVMLKGRTEEEQVCGLLHDLVEDTDWTFEQLEKSGFPLPILYALRCLTHRDNEPYESYIERVKTSKLAINVKINDLEDNMDVKRLSEITDKDAKRLAKYLRVYQELLLLRS
jgi:(p)ppGpp synthase/HD superfamily hydrolase